MSPISTGAPVSPLARSFLLLPWMPAEPHRRSCRSIMMRRSPEATAEARFLIAPANLSGSRRFPRLTWETLAPQQWPTRIGCGKRLTMTGVKETRNRARCWNSGDERRRRSLLCAELDGEAVGSGRGVVRPARAGETGALVGVQGVGDVFAPGGDGPSLSRRRPA